MLNFVRKAFRALFVIFLWIIPIGSAIAGAIAGGGAGRYNGNAFLFGLLGFIGGVIGGGIIAIFTGGLIATFLNIDENLEIIKNRAAGNISPVNPPADSKET